MSAVFGRQSELDELEGFLDAVADEGSRLILLSGQAGIGKTTLWNAAIESANEHGYRVVTARPTEVETGLAFAALGDLLGPLLDTPMPDLPDPQREALDAALLRGSTASPPHPLGVSLAALNVLRIVAANEPVVVAIDDVPWLDEASARVLDFAIRRLDGDRVGFLMARRTATVDEPLPTWLSTVPPDRLIRVDVGPLSRDETDALLRARLGLSLSRAVLARLHAISGGTPFYALELGRALQRRGDWSTPEALEVPRSLDGLISARLDALDPAAAETTLFAAALAHATVPVLEAATSTERTRAGLASAEAAGVLEVAGDDVRFAHPLLAAATYGRAATDRRQQVHERLAEVATEPEERARHLARTAVGPNESIARALEDGAAAAVQRGAPEVAAELAEEAARLTPTDGVDARRRRLMSAAEHLAASGDVARGAEILAGISDELPDGPLRAHVLTRRAHLALILAQIDLAEALLLEAIPITGDDLRLQVTIHNGLAGIGYLSWRGWRRARLHMFEALAQARELGDPTLEVQMLGHAASWTNALGRPIRSLVERADGLAVPIGDVPALEHPDLQFARVFAGKGEIDEARRRLERLVGSARSSGDWTSLPRLLAVLAAIELEAGDWDRVERISTDAYAWLLQTGEGAFFQDLQVTRLQLLVLRGEVEAARALAVEVEDWPATRSTPGSGARRRRRSRCSTCPWATRPRRTGISSWSCQNSGAGDSCPCTGRRSSGTRRRRSSASVGGGKRRSASIRSNAERAVGTFRRPSARSFEPGRWCSRPRATTPRPWRLPRRPSGSTRACRCRSGPRVPGSRSVRSFAANGRRAPRDRRSRPPWVCSRDSARGSGPSEPGRSSVASPRDAPQARR